MSDLPPNTETELKLSFDPQDLARLCGVVAATGHAAGPVAVELESTYFDTADFRLRDRQVTLRVRRQGAAFVQTVKTAGDGLRRGEWEWPVPGPAPDLAVIEDAAAREELGPVAGEPLAPVFTTRVDRLVYRLDQPVVEVAIDIGEIISGSGAVEPIAEIELELKGGSAADLYRLATALAEGVPLHLEPRSKAERGFALAAGQTPAGRKASRFRLRPEQTVEIAMAAIVRHCLDHLAQNQACAVGGGDPEGVHQMRVAMRRLRSALALFRPVIPADQFGPMVDEVRWLAGELGPARDWDVFIAELLMPVRAAFAEQGQLAADLAALAEVAAGERSRAYDRARAAIGSARYTALHLRFGAWLEGRGWRRQEISESSALLFWPITALAMEMLRKRAKKIRHLGTDLPKRTAEERHELRIACKKLRYAGEFFRSLFDEAEVKRYLGRLAVLQDVFGHLNDVTTATHLLGALALDGPAARGAGLICGWYARGADLILPQAFQQWDEFRAERSFWRDPVNRGQ